MRGHLRSPGFESACGGSTPPWATRTVAIVGTRMNARDERAKNSRICKTMQTIRSAGGTWSPHGYWEQAGGNPGPKKRCIPRCYPGDLASRGDTGRCERRFAHGARAHALDPDHGWSHWKPLITLVGDTRATAGWAAAERPRPWSCLPTTSEQADWATCRAYSSISPPIRRRCRRNVYDGSAARCARYSSKAVCRRSVSPARILRA